jgi:hypothetical protein
MFYAFHDRSQRATRLRIYVPVIGRPAPADLARLLTQKISASKSGVSLRLLIFFVLRTHFKYYDDVVLTRGTFNTFNYQNLSLVLRSASFDHHGRDIHTLTIQQRQQLGRHGQVPSNDPYSPRMRHPRHSDTVRDSIIDITSPIDSPVSSITRFRYCHSNQRRPFHTIQDAFSLHRLRTPA